MTTQDDRTRLLEAERMVSTLNQALSRAIGSLVVGSDDHRCDTAAELSRVMDDTNAAAREWEHRHRRYVWGEVRDWAEAQARARKGT